MGFDRTKLFKGFPFFFDCVELEGCHCVELLILSCFASFLFYCFAFLSFWLGGFTYPLFFVFDSFII